MPVGSVLDEREQPTELLTSGGGRRSGSWRRVGPVLLASAVVAVVAVGRPPPADPVVDISLRELSTGRYLAAVRIPGEQVRVLGIVGPGLSDPTSTMDLVTSRSSAEGELGATVDCRDGNWWAASPQDYRVRVERIDRHGRVIGFDAPLVDGVNSWADRVRVECFEKALITLPPVVADVATPEGSAQLRVVLRVTNPYAFPIRAAVAGIEDRGFRWHETAGFELRAGGQTQIGLVLGVDCRAGPPRLPSVTVTAGSSTYSGPGVPLTVDAGREGDPPSYRAWILPLSSSVADAIDGAAVAWCGRPAL